MKNLAKAFTVTVVLLTALIFSVFAGGKSDGAGGAVPSQAPTVQKVNIGVHGNGGGAGLAAVAMERGFFAEAGIDPQVVIVESGPVEMAAMRADNPSLDIGYIGPGVAWNPIDSSGNSLSFVFFDNLGNSERLVARKGAFKDSNGNGKYDQQEIFDGLKGKSIYLELGTTPGGWLKNLLTVINAGKAAQDQLWMQCEDAAYLAGYRAPNSNSANRVQVINYANANIGAGMATASESNRVDIALAFEPVPSTILNTNKEIEMVADISILPKEMVFPATFVANSKWLSNNPELVQKFINALYKAAVWRAQNPDEAMTMAEKLCQKPAGTFNASSYYFPTGAEYKEWFSNSNAAGYGYMRSLYQGQLPNVPAGANPKTFERAVDFSFMLKAIAQ
ncbi:MAG: ABC transporter substrate-binding protein [Treponema sp.]|jgi:NitT/TauT family transport system substrate-binding protein|nr:ABC transporter substrate-binding protein [Treponema sp.]